METIIQSIRINAPAEKCYEYSVNMENLASWGNGINSSVLVSKENSDELDYEVGLGLLFMNFSAVYKTFDRNEPGLNFKAALNGDTISMEDLYSFTPIGANETRLELKHVAKLAQPWSYFGMVYKVIASSQIFLDINNLKRQIEHF